MSKIIYKITFLALLIFFISASPSQAAFECSWTDAVAKTQQYGSDREGYTAFTTPGCPDGTRLGAISSCTGTKKEGQECCCSQAATPIEDVKQPKFVIPDFQVNIPGLDRLSEISCSEGVCEVPWISEYAFAFYTFGLNIVGILAVLVLMVAGVLWIVSGGDAGKITQAKKLIAGSATGLVLIVGANLILNFINPELVKKNSVLISYIDRIDPFAIPESEQVSAPTSAASSHGVPWFFQCSPEGKAVSYNLNGKCKDKSSTICSSGCGVVATLMVMSSLGQTPALSTWTDKVEASGGRVCGSGSSAAGLIKAAEAYGLKGRHLGNTGDITQALDAGHPVIISVRQPPKAKKGSCKFTGGGHFIVLTGWRDKNKLIADVNDPNNPSQKAEKRYINLNTFEGCDLGQSFYLYK